MASQTPWHEQAGPSDAAERRGSVSGQRLMTPASHDLGEIGSTDEVRTGAAIAGIRQLSQAIQDSDGTSGSWGP
jgi:hypothetical protein